MDRGTAVKGRRVRPARLCRAAGKLSEQREPRSLPRAEITAFRAHRQGEVPPARSPTQRTGGHLLILICFLKNYREGYFTVLMNYIHAFYPVFQVKVRLSISHLEELVKPK